jgi:hypothetical protein
LAASAADDDCQQSEGGNKLASPLRRACANVLRRKKERFAEHQVRGIYTHERASNLSGDVGGVSRNPSFFRQEAMEQRTGLRHSITHNSEFHYKSIA